MDERVCVRSLGGDESVGCELLLAHFDLTNFVVINVHLCSLKFTYGLWLGCRKINEGKPLVEFNDHIACA